MCNQEGIWDPVVITSKAIIQYMVSDMAHATLEVMASIAAHFRSFRIE